MFRKENKVVDTLHKLSGVGISGIVISTEMASTGKIAAGAAGKVILPPSETTALISSDKVQDAEDLKRLKAYQP